MVETDPLPPAQRLRAFREARKITLRAAARQLRVAHPALSDWETGDQIPSPPYRAAIEVWTRGQIAADEWPVKGREREAAENAAKVVPCADSIKVPAAAPSESGTSLGPGIASANDSSEHSIAKPPESDPRNGTEG